MSIPAWKPEGELLFPSTFFTVSLYARTSKIILIRYCFSQFSVASHRAAQFWFWFTLVEKINSSGKSKLKNFQERKMPHGIPSCWNDGNDGKGPSSLWNKSPVEASWRLITAEGISTRQWKCCTWSGGDFAISNLSSWLQFSKSRMEDPFPMAWWSWLWLGQML